MPETRHKTLTKAMDAAIASSEKAKKDKIAKAKARAKKKVTTDEYHQALRDRGDARAMTKWHGQGLGGPKDKRKPAVKKAHKKLALKNINKGLKANETVKKHLKDK